MKEKKYIMWSDGVIAGFGERVDFNNGIIDDSIYVKDPVSVVFSVVPKETGGGSLNFEFTPWLFRALLVDSSKNVWKVNPNYVLDNDARFDKEFIERYEYTVKITDKPAKNDEK